MDYMCFFKLNRFHWHLTDNEAWRVELECYPNLTKVGAFRGYNHVNSTFLWNWLQQKQEVIIPVVKLKN